MQNAVKWIRHNQGVFTAMLICAVLLTWSVSCASKVTSLLVKDKMVSIDEFELEVDSEVERLSSQITNLIKKAELRRAEYERMQEGLRALINFAAVSVQSGGVNPAGVVGLVMGLLGVGAVIDNRIKDKVIKNRPLKVT